MVYLYSKILEVLQIFAMSSLEIIEITIAFSIVNFFSQNQTHLPSNCNYITMLTKLLYSKLDIVFTIILRFVRLYKSKQL